MLISRRPRPRGLLLVATALGAAIISTRAAVVQLQWDPSTDSNVSKYRVYSSPSSASGFSAVLNTSATAASLTNTASFVGYRFYVTALTALSLESIPSNIVAVGPSSSGPQLSYTKASGGRLSLSWTGTGLVVQSAPTILGPWTNRSTQSPVLINMTGPPQFFRLVKQ